MTDLHRPSARCAGTLAAAVAIALGATAASARDASTRTPAQPGAATLRAELRAGMPDTPKVSSPAGITLPVSSCKDDGGAGTLRAVVANAGEGDTVDLRALKCSTITLKQGAIPVLLNDLTILGPGADKLAIDGAAADRVLIHPGYGTLALHDLAVRNGASRVTGYHITGGGCIASNGYLLMQDSTVSGCYSSGEGVYGGGVFAFGVLMYTSTLSTSTGLGTHPKTGTAVFGGGGYAAYLFLTDSTISGNRALHDNNGFSSYDTGGGMFANFGGTLVGTTVEANYSAGMGGGVSTFIGNLFVVNSTVSGNRAKTIGGGLDLRQLYVSAIYNSTIANNFAASGGGVYLAGRSEGLYLQSTIVGGNAGSNDDADIGAAFAASIVGANNLVVAADAGLTLPADTLRADPKLHPLAGNGGPTRTHALSPGSPALDAGNDIAGLQNDQRGNGFPRIRGAAADIGAFEGVLVLPSTPVPVASRTVLALLAALLALVGASRTRWKNRFFTRLSPVRAHSSQK
jgi:hypothetical protein